MIVSLLLFVAVAILKWILSILPSLPSMPKAITDVLDFPHTFLGSMFGFVVHIYGVPLVFVVVSLLVSIFLFNQGYMVAVWILKRIRLWK